ncbi:MAG: hypothetical protein HUU35_14495, partial [Armatimonadetes bacterium]|nr:hypothetical protein [Armatimonadota bacterium]
QPPAALRGPLVALAAALLVLAPWLLYSQLTFGTVQQASGTMKMLWHDHAWAFMDPLHRWLDVVAQARTWLVMSLPGVHQNVITAAPVTTLWKLLVVVAATLVLSHPGPRQRGRALLTALAWPLLYYLLAGFVYASRFRDIQSWYGAVPTVVLSLTALAVAGLLMGHPDRLTRRCWSGLVMLLLVFHLPAQARQYGHWLERGLWPWQVDVHRSTLVLAERLPRAARVGAFNAGIPAYFGEQQVINLDGLVNLTAMRHWQTRSLDIYVQNAGLDYLIDETTALERATDFMRRPLQLEEVEQFPLRGWPGDPYRYVWRILPPLP